MTSGLTGVELVELVRGANSWVAVGAASEEQARVAEAAAEGFERATLEDSALDREPSAEIFLFAR
jgi:ribosomal protein L12E/L44/L45/RPP1/RPP2